MKSLNENTTKKVNIIEAVEEIKYNQKETIKLIEKNHKTNMKKFEKIQEFNEINDMTNAVFEARISKIEEILNDIYSKIA